MSTKPSPGGERSLPQASSASGVEGEAKMVFSNVTSWRGTEGDL
jgi:hypothetical protein